MFQGQRNRARSRANVHHARTTCQTLKRDFQEAFRFKSRNQHARLHAQRHTVKLDVPKNPLQGFSGLTPLHQALKLFQHVLFKGSVTLEPQRRPAQTRDGLEQAFRVHHRIWHTRPLQALHRCLQDFSDGCHSDGLSHTTPTELENTVQHSDLKKENEGNQHLPSSHTPRRFPTTTSFNAAL
jgi:hypothetical protein